MKRQRVLAITVGAFIFGGVLMVGSGGGVSYAASPSSGEHQTILNKLAEVLTAIEGLGGGQEGNHTLRWDTHNPSASRFVTAFTGAVLDKNTGLVWEQAPDGTTRNWSNATRHCLNSNGLNNNNAGGTRGWRLPSVAELASLIDPSLPAPFVPASAFTISTSPATPGVQSDLYWSASTHADVPTDAWGVVFLLAMCSAAIRRATATAAPGVCAVA